MKIAISALMTFPPIAWWQAVAPCQLVRLDLSLPFQKAHPANRYRIATANGPLLLSVPVIGGRGQRQPMQSLRIEAKTDWQKQHWRSVFSAYGRAPFFEHYGPELEALFRQPFEALSDFNLAGIHWAVKALQLPLTCAVTNTPSTGGTDLRQTDFMKTETAVKYPQVFDDRHSFLPNLSVLDLLMNEGPAARQLIMGT